MGNNTRKPESKVEQRGCPLARSKRKMLARLKTLQMPSVPSTMHSIDIGETRNPGSKEPSNPCMADNGNNVTLPPNPGMADNGNSLNVLKWNFLAVGVSLATFVLGAGIGYVIRDFTAGKI